MTMFSATASPGQRWKMFLPGAASIQGDVLSMPATSDLIRSRWLSGGARESRGATTGEPTIHFGPLSPSAGHSTPRAQRNAVPIAIAGIINAAAKCVATVTPAVNAPSR